METKYSAGLAIIYDNKILLGHTTGRGWYASYGIPKGGIESNESKLEAAIRETYEEVGIKVPLSMIDKTEHTFALTSNKHKFSKVVYYYIVKDLKDIGLSDLKVPKKQLQVEEIDWAGFLDYTEAKKRVMKSQAIVIDNLLSKGLIESTMLTYDKFKLNIIRL
jgi:8-oxo-dGTP pyrophosphatase MutT (NUDIX family)